MWNHSIFERVRKCTAPLRLGLFVVVLCFLLGQLGCGPAAEQPKTVESEKSKPLSKRRKRPAKKDKGTKGKDKQAKVAKDKTRPDGPTPSQKAGKDDPKDSKSADKEERSLAQLLKSGGHEVFQGRFEPVNEELAAANGLRKLEGKHVTLFTDLPSSPAVDELPKVFDLAVPHWCEYFGVDPEKTKDLRLIGSVILDREKFVRAKLLNEFVPNFRHGYALADRFWVLDQPSDYYRRHLVLHEGTHAFLRLFRGGMGPPWFAEGLAELLGTHQFKDGKLQLNYFPPDKEEVDHWGRIKIVKDDYAAKRGMMLLNIMSYSSNAHLEVEPYGWCWAASVFFDRHPQLRPLFRELQHEVADSSGVFSRKFYQKLMESNNPETRKYFDFHQQWQLFISQMEYGYDYARELIDQKAVKALEPGGSVVSVKADRGWQSSGVHLEPGSYEVVAEGRFQVGNKPQPWWCEPNGITMRYYAGRPLGKLLAAVCPEVLQKGMTPMATPQEVGVKAKLNVATAGTLMLRINEFPNELSDNQGQLTVRIKPLPN